MIIIFSGAIGRCCGLGGLAWMYMQYLAGLRALGHDVFYLEDCGQESWVYNWETKQLTMDLKYPAAYVSDCLEPLGFKGKWIYRAGDRSEGMGVDDFLQACSQADCVILHAIPVSPWRAEYDWPKRRIFIDVDPGFTQISLLNGDPNLLGTLERCQRLFTVGQGIGKADCSIPTAGRHWFKTVNLVSIPDWPMAESGAASHFTSIMSWRGFRDVVYEGVVYGQKDKEFPKFIELPRYTSQPFRIALTGVPLESLSKYGWDVMSGEIPSRTPCSYREFIQNSRAEFGVAKHGYVLTRGGWFGDRSVCYLASGRPVLVQDTGLSDWLPTGDGILTFGDLAEALKGIETINADYDHHRRAARLLAEQYFAAERVLPLLLDEAMD